MCEDGEGLTIKFNRFDSSAGLSIYIYYTSVGRSNEPTSAPPLLVNGTGVFQNGGSLHPVDCQSRKFHYAILRDLFLTIGLFVAIGAALYYFFFQQNSEVRISNWKKEVTSGIPSRIWYSYFYTHSFRLAVFSAV